MLDLEFHKELRENVTKHYLECKKRFDKEGNLILEIGIETYNYKSLFEFAKIETLDIDKRYNPTFVQSITDLNTADKIDRRERYDAILCCEVLEHCDQPFFAMDVIFSLLKPGGIAFISTPFDFVIHGPGMDNWRFTKQGLNILYKKYKVLDLSEKFVSGHKNSPIQYTSIIQKL